MCPERYQTHAWGTNISQGSHYPPHACLNVGPSQPESPWGLCYLGRNANDLLRNAASGQRPVRGSYLQPHSPRDPGWYTLETWWLDVTVRHTSTIQFQERTLVIPLPRVPGSILCPAQAMALYLQRTNVTQHAPGPLFLCDPTPDGRALTSPIFNRRVKSLLQAAALPADQLAGHSFRRGGATLAYAAGIPVDTIRIIGDWASNAYTAYILPQRHHVSQAIRLMADDATDQCRHQV